MVPPRHLATARLILRPVEGSDAEPIFRTYAGEAAPTRYMNFVRHRRLSESQAFAERCVECWERSSAFHFAIVEQASAAFLGVIELRLHPPKADFGYIIGERFWGRGFATEAADAVVDWTLRQPSIFRVWATCHPDNVASARVLAKAGLELEATLANWEARPQLGEPAGPSLVFARLRPD